MIITDNSIIYGLLESSNRLFSDFSADRVLVFEHDDDFFAVFYTAVNRDFTAYAAPGFRQRPDALPELLQVVQDAQSIPQQLRNAAVLLVEHELHSQNNSRFFFDAH